MKLLKKLVGLKKSVIKHYLVPKWHFLGLGKQPKTNIKSEIQPNL